MIENENEILSEEKEILHKELADLKVLLSSSEVHICIYMCIYTCIFIYILYTELYIYIYIYIYIYGDFT
jgi:hypothetical protein